MSADRNSSRFPKPKAVPLNASTLDLAAVVARAAPDELPQLIGELEAAKAAAWARLTAPPSSRGGADLEAHLLSMPEVAERLHITEHQAREMGRRGELPVVRVGERHVRVSASSLVEWIRRRGSGTLSRPRAEAR